MTDSASQSLVAELEMLLAAVHADDPKREILVRVGDALREAETAAARISELEAELREANRSWNERCVTTSINAYGWMRAHDQLLGFMQSRPELSAALMVSGPNIKCPSPEDAPELLQRALAAESDLARVRGELDASNNNHRAMAHQMAELGARCKHAESELSRVEEDTRERCAAVALDNRQHSNQLSYRDDSNGYAEMAYEQACDDIVECIRSHPPLAKRGEQKSCERSNPPAEQSPTLPQQLTEN
ncbi:MAG: hypothetical protein JZU55_02625 [Afipia sp.]|nr:hypothetical protein [Afipia sp.]